MPPTDLRWDHSPWTRSFVHKKSKDPNDGQDVHTTVRGTGPSILVLKTHPLKKMMKEQDRPYVGPLFMD